MPDDFSIDSNRFNEFHELVNKRLEDDEYLPVLETSSRKYFNLGYTVDKAVGLIKANQIYNGD